MRRRLLRSRFGLWLMAGVLDEIRGGVIKTLADRAGFDPEELHRAPTDLLLSKLIKTGRAHLMARYACEHAGLDNELIDHCSKGRCAALTTQGQLCGRLPYVGRSRCKWHDLAHTTA